MLILKLHQIKNHIYMKSYLLYFALFFIILCFSFRGNENEFYWAWRNLHWVPAVLVGMSLVCVALHVYYKKKKL